MNYGNIIIDGVIPKINLYPGRYFLSAWIMDSAVQRDVDFPRMCAELNILPIDPMKQPGV
jgi:hypothetical protein